MKLDDVLLWLLHRAGGGTGHVVTHRQGEYYYTACKSLFVGGHTQAEQPKRVCRKCREALQYAKAINAAPGGGA